jgi:DNA-directed RNA polymerase specialized sigma24 family protein
MAPASVTHWITQVKAGDGRAAQQLWERYYRQLVNLARDKLQGLGCRRIIEDEEDAALSALDSFCRGAEKGKFPKLADRQDLWQVLVVVTARKALDVRDRQKRLKRGGGVKHSSDGIEEVVGREPTPDFAILVAEEFQHLLNLLPDDRLRTLAVCKLEGYTSEEIATKLDCSLTTVERKLRLIRQAWEKEIPR